MAARSTRSRETRVGPSRGFTLVEILVVVLILAVMAALTVPTFKGRLSASYEDSLIEELSNLATAVTAFQHDVGKYPPFLNYLTRPQRGETDLCGNVLTARDSAKFRGPYLTRVMDTTQTSYVFANKDTIETALLGPLGGPVFTVPDSTQVSGTTYAHWLGIEVLGLDLVTAQHIDLKVDGVANQNDGQIRYNGEGGIGNDYYLLYLIPIPPVCNCKSVGC